MSFFELFNNFLGSYPSYLEPVAFFACLLFIFFFLDIFISVVISFFKAVFRF